METPRARSLLQYWRHPCLADGQFEPLGWYELAGWVGVMLVLSFIASGIGAAVLHLSGHALPPDTFILRIARHPSWRFAALLLIAPVLEEWTFRAFMTRGPRMMTAGIGFLGTVVLGLIVHALRGSPVMQQHDIARAYLLNVLVIMPVAGVFAALAWWLRRRWQPLLLLHAPWAIVLATLLFAGVHEFNFDLGAKIWLLWLTLPQLMAGIVLVYVRVRHGLRWSIALHLAFDWLLMCVAWTTFAAKTHSGVFEVAAVLARLLLLGALLWGLVSLFRRGVLRPA